MHFNFFPRFSLSSRTYFPVSNLLLGWTRTSHPQFKFLPLGSSRKLNIGNHFTTSIFVFNTLKLNGIREITISVR